MPPKAKFTKQEILNAAMAIVRRNGFSALTARALGDELNSSSRPIFTAFSGMDEVLSSVVAEAKAIYKSYIEKGLKEQIAFRGVGAAYVKFAASEPELFKLLFMKSQPKIQSTATILADIDESYEKILNSITSNYGLDRNTAENVYLHLWIYTHGIATLIATGVCTFSPEEITAKLTEIFKSLIKSKN